MKFENPFKKAPVEQSDIAETSLGRRDFLKLGASAVAGGVLGYGLGAVHKEIKEIEKGKTLDDYKLGISEFINQSELYEKILKLKTDISVRYDIFIYLDQAELNNTYASSSHPDSELRLTKQIEALEILSEELEKYPDFMIRQYGLETMSITTRARNENKEVGGFLMQGNLDSIKVTELPEIVLYYDWNAPYLVPEDLRVKGSTNLSEEEKVRHQEKSRNENFKKTIHHELLHFMVDVPGAEKTPRNEEYIFVKNWNEEFGFINEEIRENRNAVFNVGTIGHAREYGLKNEKEDRATIAEEMFAGGLYSKAEEDHVLKRKIEILKEYYLNASCGLMDELFWLNVATQKTGSDLQRYFTEEAKYIITTKYDSYHGENKVSRDKYERWQNKLKHTNLV
jgi:hypothetical protein